MNGFASRLIMAVVVLWQADAIAQVPKHIEQWQSNVCRVTASDPSGRGVGTGVYLGKGYVLTAFHVVRDVHRTLLKNRTSITVEFHEQGMYSATIGGWNSNYDVAYLKIDKPKEANVKGVLLASADPKLGDITWKCGYGPDDRLIWHKCTVTGNVANRFGERCWFDLTPWSRSGDSGGPVFDANGRLLGNLWGSSPIENATTAVLPSAITKSLDAQRSKLVNYHVQCYGPQCYQDNPFLWSPHIQPQIQGGSDPRLMQPAPGGIPANPNPQNTNPQNTNPIVPSPASPAPSNPQQTQPVTPNVDLSPIKDGLAKLQEQFGQLAQRDDRSNLENRLDSISNENRSLKSTVEGLAGRLRELPGELRGSFRGSLTTAPETLSQTSEFDWTHILWSAGIAAAGLTGVGLPLWAIWAMRGVSVARRRIRRVRKRRQAQQPEMDRTPSPEPAPEPPPVPSDFPVEAAPIHTETRYVVDGPPLPARHTIESRLVHAPIDRYEIAHEKAREHIFRRYPGSQEILEAEKNLTKQFLAGEPSA